MDEESGAEVEKFSWMMWVVRRMDWTFVPDCRPLVTTGWIYHSPLLTGPIPFVTTKTTRAIHGGRNAVNTQIAVTSANTL